MSKLTTNILFLLLIGSITVFAQPKGKEIVIGSEFSIQSEVLGEERPYLVHLPPNYRQDGDPVTVMYLMDGRGHFHHTTGIVDYLARHGRIPSMMVVAIPNTNDRTRDLTPTVEKNKSTLENMPTAGGADKTLSFIREELIPHIDNTYNTNDYRLLVGHSFGGIFAVQALMTQSDIYDSFISISPSMWWDDQNLTAKAEAFLKSEPDLDGYFYMTMGNEGGTMLGGAMKLAALFEELAPPDFDWDFKVMKEETHGTVPHRSTYYGLEAIFKDWYRADVAKIYTEGGMEALNAHYATVSQKLGYEKQAAETDLNNLGYNLFRRNMLEKAIEVFEENVNRYPKSFNVYDSLAEAFMAKKDNASAIKYYKRSLELHPGNQNGVNMLKQMGVEYDPMSTAIELSSKKRKPFVGAYKTSMGVLTVEEIDGHLVASMTPVLDKEKMIPFENNRFLLQSMNIPIAFELNGAKQAVSFEAQMGIGNIVKGERIQQ